MGAITETHLDNTMLFETTAAGVQAGDFVVLALRGAEALSTPYEFRLTLECTIDGGASPDTVDAMLAATCHVAFGPDALYRVSGVLRQIELLEMEVDGSSAIYEAVLVPRVWLGTLSRRSRCFNDMAVPDIIRAVLTDLGLAEGKDFDLHLSGTYTPREYVVQYEETDFAFLSRWMERLGIFYYFEQTDENEKLVIVDSNGALVPARDHAEVTYAHLDPQGVVGAIHRMRRRDRRVPRMMHVRDYNWRTPAQLVHGAADIDAQHGFGMQAYSGDHFKDDGEGATYATVRAEGWLATKRVFSAWTVNPDFAPGYRFTVSGAPVGELDTEYVITRVTHVSEQSGEAAGAGTYRNDVEAIAYSTAYRPPRVTPWPRIDGVIHAKIDAESISSAAPIDDKGRYKVVFPYDLYAEFGGKATRWVRKAEPYSGQEYGMHFTLHTGAEIAIAHVNGDPDRPIIVGSVPHGVTTSP
ncbi:MAG: type VI secretion system tip protein VgrG [Sandaracinaceae bacterium]|nr:type VI secretion system tip protein VgrG [Sandaracinaceae bacterium]